MICIPSPRDIFRFKEAADKLTYPKLWAKYYFEQEAYQILRHHFLKMPEYTHFVILPDDLIVTQSDVDTLVADLEKYDYPVLSGYCMVNRDAQWNGKVAVSKDVINPHRQRRNIEFMDAEQIEKMDRPKPIMSVGFSGFPLMFIRRDVVEKIQFEDDRYYNKWPIRGCCMDITFCWKCVKENDIPVHVDFNVFTEHLAGARTLEFGVGKYKPYVMLNDSVLGAEPKILEKGQFAGDTYIVNKKDSGCSPPDGFVCETESVTFDNSGAFYHAYHNPKTGEWRYEAVNGFVVTAGIEPVASVPDTVIETYYGYVMNLGNRFSFVTKDLKQYGQYEPAMTEWFLKNIKPDWTVVDIGANIGYYTLLFAHQTPRGDVYAFEPESYNFGLLRENLFRRNDFYDNVKIENAAVSNVSGPAKLWLSDQCMGMHRMYESQYATKETQSIKTVTLDEYFKPGTKIDIIKIDAEGWEYYALQGMERVIKDNEHLTIVMEYVLGKNVLAEANVKPSDIDSFLDRHGFKVIRIGDNVVCQK